MTPLFSDQGRERFEQLVKPGMLCAFDFDGTLAPIVAQPERAFLPLDLLQQLVELSRYAPVAIITGRSVTDLRARLGFNPDFIVGNHGLEGLPGWELRAERYETLCRSWRKQLEAALAAQEMTGTWVWVENKRYSLSLHYRPGRDAESVEKKLQEIFERMLPRPRVVAGKRVFNLVPEDALDKGGALENLMRESGAASAVYVGDDVTDEDVFRLRRDDVLSVRIEPGADTAAPFFLERRQDMPQMLDALISRLRQLHATNWTRHEAVDAVDAGTV